jgi:hypothetical protein
VSSRRWLGHTSSLNIQSRQSRGMYRLHVRSQHRVVQKVNRQYEMVENYLGLIIRSVGVLRPTTAESQSRLFLLACALETSKA